MTATPQPIALVTSPAETAGRQRRTRAATIVETAPPTAPRWVVDLLHGTDDRDPLDVDGVRLEMVDRGSVCWIQATVERASALDSRAFEIRVAEVYSALHQTLAERRAGQPIRFWNFVPGIHRPAHDGMDHYETFNAGRFAAFTEWYGTRDIGPHMVAASGVGHDGDAFVVQVLATEQAGSGLENPRQVAAWRYSQRYGPLPPCFARATRAEAVGSKATSRDLLIVAGTASVVGEDSAHVDNLHRQVDETCINLRHLLGEAGEPCLGRFRQLRAYVVEPHHREALTRLLLERFPAVEHLELVPADLCRRDLLVEVEGIVPL